MKKQNFRKYLSIFVVAMLIVTMAVAVTPAFAAEGDVTVTWDVGGTTSTTTVAPGAVPARPTNPSKVGYVFSGWGLSASSTAVLDKLPAVYQDTTFYAVFKPIKFSITWIYYDADGILQTKIFKSNYGVVPDAPEAPATINGSQFLSWDKEVVAVTADATYTAIYNHAQYVVTYIADAGEEITEDEIYASGVEDVSKYEAPEKEGYSFRGWSTKKDSRADIIGEDYRIKADTTLYAVYTINAWSWFTALAWYWKALIIVGIILIVGGLAVVILKKVGVFD